MTIRLTGEQLTRLRDSFQQYAAGSHYRANALAVRARAHTRIRELTAPDRLPGLALDDFDRHVWLLGSMAVDGRKFDWHHADRFLASTPPSQVTAMLDSGALSFIGNMTWGSAAGTLRAYAHGQSPEELEKAMKRALGLLLHMPGPIETRLKQIAALGVGFGRNVSSGLLTVWYPKEFILYNSRSDQVWADFGLDVHAGLDWVRPYLDYTTWCSSLLADPVLKLQDLVDLDIFVYWYSEYCQQKPAKPEHIPGKRGRKPKVDKGGITLEQLKVTKRQMTPEDFRATWGDLYDRLVAAEMARPVTTIGPAELGERAYRQVGEIQAFLLGKAAGLPSGELLCQWIDFCYALDLYREAAGLFVHVHQEQVDPAFYRRAKRIAEVCRAKLIG